MPISRNIDAATRVIIFHEIIRLLGKVGVYRADFVGLRRSLA